VKKLAFVIFAVSALALPGAASGRFQSFRHPTLKIACTYYETDLECSSAASGVTVKLRLAGERERKPLILRGRPSAWGSSASRPALRYGKGFNRMGFMCTSLRAGMRCWDDLGYGGDGLIPHWGFVLGTKSVKLVRVS
jgi:hypothetical protein